MTVCPYSDNEDQLPKEDTCLDRRRERRLLPHRNLWPGCACCGRVLSPIKSEDTQRRNKRQGIGDPELPVGLDRTRRGAVGVPETGPATSPKLKSGRGAFGPSPTTTTGPAPGKAAPRYHQRRYVSFAGGPTPKNAPQLTDSPKRPKGRPRKERPALPPAPKPERVFKGRRHQCFNCGVEITYKHRGCKPCLAAEKRFKDSTVELLKALDELKRLRAEGKLRRGRPVDPGGVHRGWPQGVPRGERRAAA